MLRCRVRAARGAELIELALVLPILLLVFAGIADFALMSQNFLTVSNAAREGARIAVLPGYTEEDVIKRVEQYVGEGIGDNGGDDPLEQVSIDPDGDGPKPAFPAVQVTVTMTHNYLFLGPVSGLLGGGSFSSITLTGRSTMRVEQ